MSEPAWEDPIVEEVREARDAIARECNYDARTLFEKIKAHESGSGRQYISLPPKRLNSEPEAHGGAA